MHVGMHVCLFAGCRHGSAGACRQTGTRMHAPTSNGYLTQEEPVCEPGVGSSVRAHRRRKHHARDTTLVRSQYPDCWAHILTTVPVQTMLCLRSSSEQMVGDEIVVIDDVLARGPGSSSGPTDPRVSRLACRMLWSEAGAERRRQRWRSPRKGRACTPWA